MKTYLQDLVFIEEAFERLLLDYDRVFSAMGVPACLWRRTGEIYKGNREFSELVGVDGYMLRDVSHSFLTTMTHRPTWNFYLGTPLHLRIDGRGICGQLLGGKAFSSILRQYGSDHCPLCRNMVKWHSTPPRRLC